jgi:hypothetical protein
MTGRSIIPEAGDCRWRTRRGPALILLGSLAFDAALVLTIVAWCSS